MAVLYGLSLTQPWATLMALGHKSIETRSWGPAPARLGSLVAIQAAKAFPEEAQMICYDEPFEALLRRHGHIVDEDPPRRGSRILGLPRGVVVAVGILDARVQIGQSDADSIRTDSPLEFALGDYTPGRWAWIFRDVVPLGTPVSVRGQPMLWEFVDDREKVAVLAQTRWANS